MRSLIVTISIVATLILFVGCKTTCPTIVETITETKVETRTEFVKDTVFVEVPAQTAERDTHDGRSFLENDFALSNAWINEDGSLHHDLSTKPQVIPKPFDKPVEHHDSIVYRDRKVKVPYPVEAKLTKWQSMKLDTYSYLLAALLVCLIILFRKPLFTLVRRFI